MVSSARIGKNYFTFNILEKARKFSILEKLNNGRMMKK